MKQLLMAMVAVLGISSAFAAEPNTWWVAKEDANASDELVTGRGTEALPFRTIQAALDNPGFLAGDTVLVKPGDYDEVETRATGNYKGSNRVTIVKTVYLKAYDTTPIGRAKTCIIGKIGTTSTSVANCGTNCVRCICVTSAADGTVIEGFTLKDGCAFYNDGGGTWATRELNLGGGVYVPSGTGVTVVDCVFDRCIAANGGTAIYNGTAIRCEMKNCIVRREGLMNGTVAFACLAHDCKYNSGGSSSDTHIVGKSSVAVGCTFFNNNVYGIRASGGEAYNCIFEKHRSPHNVEEGASAYDCYVSDVATNDYFATGFADYRLLDESPAIGVGWTGHKQVLIDKGVPEVYLERDLAGKTIDWSTELNDMNAGAFMVTAVPETGRVTFSADTYVDGWLVEANTWIRSETFPAQYVIEPADKSKELFNYSRTAQGSSVKNVRPYNVYPQMDGTVRILLPRRTVTTPDQTYEPHYVAATIWADPSDKGSDETGDGSEEKPYQSLQKAVDSVAKSYTLIRARRGDYKTGGQVCAGLMTRVDMTGLGVNGSKRVVKILAEEGPDVTAIWGAADETTLNDQNEPGCGPNAARCLALDTFYTIVQGFTLRDGYTRMSSEVEAEDDAKSGAAAFGLNNFYRQPPPVLDCVITNCVAADCVLRYAYTMRCKIVDNTSTGPIFDFGFHAADLVVGNRCSGIFGTSSSYVLRSFMLTCVDNVQSPGASAFDDWKGNDLVFRSIVVGGRVATAAATDIGNVVWEHTSTSKLKSDSVVGDPLFADRASGDYRPACGSVAVDSSPATGYSSFTEYITSDFNGEPLRITADGKLTAGCFQGNLPRAIIVSCPEGSGLHFNGQTGSAVTNVVEQGGSVDVTISGDATTPRWTKGFVLDGVKHLFTDYPGSETTTFTSEKTGYQINPIVSTEWYVDARNGNDANKGFTVAAAKKTLAEVFTNCAVTAGDTVYALPGTYNRGVMRQNESTRTWSRAVVPEGVTLAATGSAEETIILGADSPEPVNDYGQGPDAVRCLYARKNSTVRGLTLKGGRTQKYVEGVTEGSEVNGGGILSADNTVMVSDCIIRNNVASYGGGTYYGEFVKCRLLGNVATQNGNGAAGRYGYYLGCFVDENDGVYTIMYPTLVYSCTIGYNNGGRSVYFYQPEAEDFKVFNSILYKSGNNQSVYWNCLVYTNFTGSYNVSAKNLKAGNCRGFANYKDFKLDGNMRPLKDSPAVDAGDNDNRGPYFPEVDLDGVPRVLNGGRFDIGAFEYDWRIDYSKDLGKGILVTDASPNVVETKDGKVEVPKDASLKLDWRSRKQSVAFMAQVKGTGALAVNLNGEPFMTLTETDSPKVSIPETLDLTKLEFVFSGSGSATLSGFKRECGLIFIVR